MRLAENRVAATHSLMTTLRLAGEPRDCSGLFSIWYPHRELHSNLRFRRPPFFLLNYKGIWYRERESNPQPIKAVASKTTFCTIRISRRLVGIIGIEPIRANARQILSLLCLPNFITPPCLAGIKGIAPLSIVLETIILLLN